VKGGGREGKGKRKETERRKGGEERERKEGDRP